MTILGDFELPASSADLPVSADATSPLYVAFIASDDPATGRPWCPDVRAALPSLKAAFSGKRNPEVAFVAVGQKPSWKRADNIFRTKWNVDSIPTLMRYERVQGAIRETGRLVEDEILDAGRLNDFLGKQE